MTLEVPSLRFHHTGIACSDLAAQELGYAKLGYVREGDIFEDPVQRIRGLFLIGPGPRLELVMPTAPDSPVAGWIARGVHFYHLAYEVLGTLETEIERLCTTARARVTSAPMPAVAFGGRRIVFLYFPNKMLIELIETRA